MKKIYIIRHAKSSWADTEQADIDRPLNDRGKRDAPRMGKRLKERDIHPDLVLSSHAKRARSTAKRIGNILNYSIEKIKLDKKLYHADEETILSVVQGLNNKFNTVLLVGHNPGLTDFVNILKDDDFDIDNIPTCGVVAFQIEVGSWSEVRWGQAKMIFFDYPKSKED